MRSLLYPLIGNRIYGALGHLVDVLSVFGTLFGVATSLRLGVMQINSGLDYLGVLSSSLFHQILLIAGITSVAAISVASGLNRGIRILSTVNLLVALALIVFVFLAGPSLFLIRTFVQNMGQYLHQLLPTTFHTSAYQGLEWQKDWTLFFWSWWIAWSPFVGMFIARVSRGRTIREFILGVLFIPTLLTCLWLVIFGNSAIHIELFGEGGLVGQVEASIPTSLFALFEYFPLPWLSCLLSTFVIVTFFVTSADSGALVINILTSGGQADPPLGFRIFWALIIGSTASILLLAGGLSALQTATLTTAFPVSLIMIIACLSLFKGLRAAHMSREQTRRRQAEKTA